MRLFGSCMALAFALVVGTVQPLAAQEIPFPEAGMAREVPGAFEMPDPNVVYKIAFDQRNGPDNSGNPTAGIMSIANRYNTLIAHGVPSGNIQFVVVIHADAADTVLENDAYRERNDGADNPDLQMIQKMKAAGIDFRVCGQGALARGIDPEDILPEVQLDLWAWVTFTNLQLQGFIRQGV